MPKYIIKIIILVVALIFAFIMQNWRRRYFDYQCAKCDEKFSLPVWQAVLSIHMLGSKFVKCPQCGKWGWAMLVPKE